MLRERCNTQRITYDATDDATTTGWALRRARALFTYKCAHAATDNANQRIFIMRHQCLCARAYPRDSAAQM